MVLEGKGICNGLAAGRRQEPAALGICKGKDWKRCSLQLEDLTVIL